MNEFKLKLRLLTHKSMVFNSEHHSFLSLRIKADSFINSTDDPIVYLYQYGSNENPIIITSNRKAISTAMRDQREVNNHYIMEFESFKDAYDTALILMESHPLCYSKGTPESIPGTHNASNDL